ncbi:MAG: PaaI family thioesterase [Thermoanaerobaculia bacterium]|nr:MAG: PaaI family thioesterase [Thermoanaerobaculia bacterium]MBZ0103967.1 PaaI family thioesterase [Thermoanaerobaculia bacterium]
MAESPLPADSHARSVRWSDPREMIRAAVERRLSGLEFLRAMQRGEVPAPPIAVLLGFEIDLVEEGRVVFALQPGEHHYNPNGVVHGGVAAMLLDTVTGCAVTTRLPFGRTCATLDLKINYIRSLTARSPRVLAEGTVLHLGRRSAVAEGRLSLPDGRLAAHATATLMLFEPDEAHAGDHRFDSAAG